MKKAIGVDIDGVITDEIHPNQNIWHNALCNYLGYDIEMVKKSYYFDKAYNLPLNVIDSFLKENIENIYKEVNLDKEARKTINYFFDCGYEIHLITARDKKHKNITEDWIRKNKIKFSSLSHEENKAPLAVKKGIEIFIEDNGENALKLSQEGIKVILINKYHNEYLKEDKSMITRVSNWLEIKRELIKLLDI
ncbi:MAG: hypothetical protein ACOC1O_01840 [bacterium]